MGLKLLNLQGYIGLGVGLVLAVLLGLQVLKTHHVQHALTAETAKYEAEHLAFGETVLNYRTAAEKARQADATNKARVLADQATINKERDAAYEARIAAARARADSLRPHASTPADPGRPGSAPVPGVPAPAGGPDGPTPEAGLPPSDALTATEQAIQLDELQHWITQQHAVDVNGK